MRRIDSTKGQGHLSMFDELPTELVERILALLSYEEKVAVLGVCKRYMNRSLVDKAKRFFPKMENDTAEQRGHLSSLSVWRR